MNRKNDLDEIYTKLIDEPNTHGQAAALGTQAIAIGRQLATELEQFREAVTDYFSAVDALFKNSVGTTKEQQGKMERFDDAHRALRELLSKGQYDD